MKPGTDTPKTQDAKSNAKPVKREGKDIKFDIKHFADIERLAMVGDKKWQHGMATFCKPFTKATIRYFDHADA